MKRNFIYSFFIAFACLGFVACDSDDNDQTKNLPEGSKPSTKFTVGNCEDEQNAKDAIKLDVKTWDDGKTDKEFVSVELFGDGHFLSLLLMPSPLRSVLPTVHARLALF